MRTIGSDEFATRMIDHAGAIKEALAKLRKRQPSYACWEPVCRDICQMTIEEITHTQQVIENLLIFTKYYFWPLPASSGRALVLAVDCLRRSVELGDESAIIIRAYAQISHKIDEPALRQLKRARQSLQTFVGEAQQGIRRLDALFPLDKNQGSRTAVVEEQPLLLPAPRWEGQGNE
ncbi:hypothetical protein KDA_77020 [Dictyobacter alpinus]|uniref:Uncharacterized protein n=1 Tax=Dictyobacter alpinus TaxID=2014873 RepID=A0A402BLH2_9CHLR|nr:hypothetical protein [Dictyobacter alpinus]GCE32218.1 hypothetical protein KDA_77020 [Dictyobacter alpinus]